MTVDTTTLMIAAQLKALKANLDVTNPMGDIKKAIVVLVENIQNVRGQNATRANNDARVMLMHVLNNGGLGNPGDLGINATGLSREAADELRRHLVQVYRVRGQQMELYGHLSDALARLQEARAHVALANVAMAKLIATVTEDVEAEVKHAAEKTPEPVPASRALRLQIHVPGVAVREETFDQDIVKVGRLPTSHLRFEDDNVSRMHAVIERDKNEGWFVIDLGSAGRTIVNDRSVNKAKLNVGDTMLFGRVSVKVLG